jgi:hypothetical protein
MILEQLGKHAQGERRRKTLNKKKRKKGDIIQYVGISSDRGKKYR